VEICGESNCLMKIFLLFCTLLLSPSDVYLCAAYPFWSRQPKTKTFTHTSFFFFFVFVLFFVVGGWGGGGGGGPYVLYIFYRFLIIALNTRTFSLLVNIMFGV